MIHFCVNSMQKELSALAAGLAPTNNKGGKQVRQTRESQRRGHGEGGGGLNSREKRWFRIETLRSLAPLQ